MNASEWVGTVGVTILLLAFALNLAKKLNSNSVYYLAMNFTGAALAGISSYMIGFWPFVVLETVWAGSSLFFLFQNKSNA